MPVTYWYRVFRISENLGRKIACLLKIFRALQTSDDTGIRVILRTERGSRWAAHHVPRALLAHNSTAQHLIIFALIRLPLQPTYGINSTNLTPTSTSDWPLSWRHQ